MEVFFFIKSVTNQEAKLIVLRENLDRNYPSKIQTLRKPLCLNAIAVSLKSHLKLNPSRIMWIKNISSIVGFNFSKHIFRWVWYDVSTLVDYWKLCYIELQIMDVKEWKVVGYLCTRKTIGDQVRATLVSSNLYSGSSKEG